MDESIAHVVKKLQATKLYPKLYYRAFQDSIITGEHTLKAIAQFVATLVSSNSKYDSVMRGQSAFTEQQKQGYLLFKKNCASCHKEPLFTNDAFENNGLSLDTFLQDFGRMRVTHNPQDSLKFRVPSLRNIEFSYPYMHDGRYKKLSQVLQHYAGGIIPSKTLAKTLQKPMKLSAHDQVDLMAFLLTLTDKTFLFNPDFSFPNKIYADTAKD